MDKKDLIYKYKILGSKLINQKRLLQAEYVRRCMYIVEKTDDIEIEGRFQILSMLNNLFKERKTGYQEAMNVVAACLALYQEVSIGPKKIQDKV